MSLTSNSLSDGKKTTISPWEILRPAFNAEPFPKCLLCVILILPSYLFNILFVLATIALVTPIQTSDVTFELLLGVGFLLSLMFFIYLSKGLNKITASMLFLGYITFLYLQFYGWV